MKGRTLGQDSLKILNAIAKFGQQAWREWQTMVREDDWIFNRRRFYKRLRDLERQGYVKRPEKKNQSFFHLTPKGRLAALKYLHLEKVRSKWDGRWRILIFDIPEILRKSRGYLRHRLKYLGFEPLQESVYISPYPVNKDVEIFLKEYNLRKYTRYLTVSEIDNDRDLKDLFHL